jgi:hypothetical protein
VHLTLVPIQLEVVEAIVCPKCRKTLSYAYVVIVCVNNNNDINLLPPDYFWKFIHRIGMDPRKVAQQIIDRRQAALISGLN